MKTPGTIRFALLPIVIWAMTHLGILVGPVYAASSPSLGNASRYSVIAGTSITNSNATTIGSNAGISPGTTLPNYSGFGTVTLGGSIHDSDSEASSAMTDANAAYSGLNAQGCDTDYGAVTKDLVGMNLAPGVYCSNAFTLSGTLTLNGTNSDVWIFKSRGSLTTTGTTDVVFSSGGVACNVWWYVPGTVTLDTGSALIGNAVTNGSVTFGSGATLNGRIFSTTADVTLDGNTITGPTCTAAPSQSSGISDGASESVQGISVCTASDIKTIPTIIETKRLSPTSVSLNWGPYEGTDTFVLEYGFTNGKWDYNTKVTGFSTTLNDLPANQPIWIHVAATDTCAIGGYSKAVEAGATPGMPETGYAPKNNFPWLLIISVGLVASSIGYLLFQIKRLFTFKR